MSLRQHKLSLVSTKVHTECHAQTMKEPTSLRCKGGDLSLRPALAPGSAGQLPLGRTHRAAGRAPPSERLHAAMAQLGGETGQPGGFDLGRWFGRTLSETERFEEVV